MSQTLADGSWTPALVASAGHWRKEVEGNDNEGEDQDSHPDREGAQAQGAGVEGGTEMKTRRFEYKPDGSSGMNGCPMIPSFRANLGQDSDGKEWLCKVSPTGQMKHLMWNVDFDTTDEYWVPVQPDWNYDPEDGNEEHSSPFLRPEVVYCKEWKWAEMHRIRYHRKTVEYIDINKVVNEFVVEHGIK